MGWWMSRRWSARFRPHGSSFWHLQSPAPPGVQACLRQWIWGENPRRSAYISEPSSIVISTPASLSILICASIGLGMTTPGVAYLSNATRMVITMSFHRPSSVSSRRGSSHFMRPAASSAFGAASSGVTVAQLLKPPLALRDRRAGRVGNDPGSSAAGDLRQSPVKRSATQTQDRIHTSIRRSLPPIAG